MNNGVRARHHMERRVLIYRTISNTDSLNAGSPSGPCDSMRRRWQLPATKKEHSLPAEPIVTGRPVDQCTSCIRHWYSAQLASEKHINANSFALCKGQLFLIRVWNLWIQR
jgi:hypothetical protein